MSRENKIKDIFVTAALCINDGRCTQKPMPKLEALSNFLASNYAHYEILVVGDSSCTELDDAMKECLSSIDYVRYMRTFGMKTYDEIAAVAFDNAIGDLTYVMPYDVDFVAEDMHAAIEECCAGNDATVVESKHADNIASRAKAATSILLDAVCGRGKIPKGFFGICCASRRIVNAAMRSSIFNEFPFLAIVSTANGCRSISSAEDYDVSCSVADVIDYAKRVLAAITTNHVQILCKTSAFAAFVAFIVSLFSKSFGGAIASFLSMSMFTVMNWIAIVFDHLRANGCFNDSSKYSIEFEKHSSVMLNTKELNIRSDSVSDTIINVQTGRDR